MKHPVSRLFLILSMMLMVYSSLVFYPRWKQPATNAAISWDVSGYYWYLPSFFIYKDIKHQSFKDSILDQYRPTGTEFQQGFMHEGSGNYVMKYSMGMAVAYSPFFFIAHLLAKPLGYPADGFSAPYQLAIQLGGLIVSLLGLWYFRKLLLQYCSDITAGIMLLLLTLGSNYLNYAAIDTGMSHAWLFTLYVLLLLNTQKFYTTFRKQEAVKIGLIIGLATLIRPTEIITVIIPLLWGLTSLRPAVLGGRIKLLAAQWPKLLLAAVLAIAVIALQPLYWHYASGQWIVYSYQDQGFYWKRPHVYNYCFNFQSGWLIYTPLLILSLLGLPSFLRNRKNTVAILAYIFIAFYVVSAWDIWNYGGFGGRAMIQSYPMIFLVFAAFIEDLRRNKYYRFIGIPLLLAGVYVNIWWTYNAHRGDVLDSLTMTKAYFFKSIGYFHTIPEQYKKLKDTDEYYEGLPQSPIAVAGHLEQDTTSLRNGSQVCVDAQHANTPYYIADDPASVHAEWLRMSAVVHTSSKEWDVWKMPQFCVRFRKQGVVVKERMIRISRFVEDGQQTKTIFLDIRKPAEAFDRIEWSVWNPGSVNLMCLDDLRLLQFKG